MTGNTHPAAAGSLQGGCACGAVRYTVQSPPMIVHCCHCSWCQRESGAACVTNALIERDRIELLRGEPETVAVASASGQGQQLCRCTACQTVLWSHYAFAGIGDKVAFLRTSTLESPQAMPADIHIFTASKQPSQAITGTRFEGYYRARDVWSESSLARKKALQAASQ